MCWSDMLFPGNSEKISILADCAKLNDLLEECFKAVNYLIDRIEENFPGVKLKKIYVQTSECLGDNCIIIILRVNQIEKLLKEKEFDVKTRMYTKLFKDLIDLSRKFEKTIIKISNDKKKLPGIVFGIVFGFVLWAKMSSLGCRLEAAFLNHGMIKTLVVVLLMLAVLFLGINMVVSAIYGVYERKKLDQALKEFARAVEDFEPLARMFCCNMCKVTELTEVHNKK